MKAELWDDIERALDARRAPFEDPALAARLALDPEAAAAVRTLMGRLEALARRRPSAPNRIPALVTAAAALLLAVLVLRPAEGARPRIVDVRLSVQRESYEPRIARVVLESTRVVGWQTAGGRP